MTKDDVSEMKKTIVKDLEDHMAEKYDRKLQKQLLEITEAFNRKLEIVTQQVGLKMAESKKNIIQELNASSSKSIEANNAVIFTSVDQKIANERIATKSLIIEDITAFNDKLSSKQFTPLQKQYGELSLEQNKFKG